MAKLAMHNEHLSFRISEFQSLIFAWRRKAQSRSLLKTHGEPVAAWCMTITRIYLGIYTRIKEHIKIDFQSFKKSLEN
jgi:hypothetical protein